MVHTNIWHTLVDNPGGKNGNLTHPANSRKRRSEMLEILYQDEHLVAINKPSGLLVHRSLIDTREREFALQLTRNQIGQRVYPVHRLDRPTSGVLLFALSSEIARQLSEQFAQHTVTKRYLALVRGYCDAEGRIEYALKEELDKISDAKAERDKDAQPAITEYTCIQQIDLPFAVGRYERARFSWLSLIPHTGRKHQLRRHMKHIFHPIVGDTSHGDGKQNAFVRDKFECHRLMLHASGLQLLHPLSGNSLNIQAGIPDDIRIPLLSMGVDESWHFLPDK